MKGFEKMKNFQKIINITLILILIALVITISLIWHDYDLINFIILLIIFIIIILLYFFFQLIMKPKNTEIINLRFTEPFESKIDEIKGNVILCSISYPEHNSQVWFVSNNSITIINSQTNKTILFSAISSVELLQTIANPDVGILSCKQTIQDQFDGTVFGTKDVVLATIHFPIEHKNVAQVIHDRISNPINFVKTVNESVTETPEKNSNSVVDELKALNQMLYSRSITQEEFDALRAKIIEK